MADFVFNVAKGKAAEKVADAATNLGMMVLATAGLEADATLRDKTDLADLVVGTTNEVTNTNYARKTGLTGTVTIDQANDQVLIDIPDQTWSAVAAGDGWSKLVIYYQEAAADSSRIPLTCHDFALTPDGSDITVTINASGFFKAA